MKLWALQKRRSLEAIIEGSQRPAEATADVADWSESREPREDPLPPSNYPQSGSACYHCKGTKDPRCCQYLDKKDWAI